MQTELTKEIMTRLDALAAKLGTTGEYLWGVLLKQAQVQVTIHVLCLVGGVVVAVLGVSFCLHVSRGNAVMGMEVGDNWRNSQISLFVLGVILVVFGAVVISVNSVSVITPLLNPEYWALHQILSIVGR